MGIVRGHVWALLCLALVLGCGRGREAKPDAAQAATRAAELLLQAWNRGDPATGKWDTYGTPRRLYGPLTYRKVSVATNILEVRVRYHVKSVTAGGLPIEKLWDLVMVRGRLGEWLADRLEDPLADPPPLPGPRRIATMERTFAVCQGRLRPEDKTSYHALQLVWCFGDHRYTLDETLAYLVAHTGLPVSTAELSWAVETERKMAHRP